MGLELLTLYIIFLVYSFDVRSTGIVALTFVAIICLFVGGPVSCGVAVPLCLMNTLIVSEVGSASFLGPFLALLSDRSSGFDRCTDGTSV